MEACLPTAPPIPSQKALTCKGGGKEAGRGREVVEEARWLEDVGRSPSSSPT